MVFSSLEFLFVFLPIVLIVYLLIPQKLANIWLMLASIAFYWLGDHFHIKLLIGVIVVTYVSGMILSHTVKEWQKKTVMTLTICMLVVLLCYYKYFDFIVTNINAWLGKDYPLKVVFFPVGVSFFIFQAISYIVDVYRGQKVLSNPIDLALYISFFPQLIAGPIVRFNDIREYMELSHRKICVDNIAYGIYRFCIGLSKKVLLANNLGIVTDVVFSAHDITKYSVLYTWFGLICGVLQIYFDFSGYSDMAIGLGRVFGFVFQENFNYPFISSSIKELWGRWHISLSQFFRDYVYLPLGGSRVTMFRWIINMMIVWFLTGLWHGANWTYIIWGVLFGISQIIEKLLQNYKSKKEGILSKVWGHFYTMMCFTIFYLFFRAESISQAGKYLKNMLGIGAKGVIDHGFLYQFSNSWLLVLIAIVFSTPVVPILSDKYAQRRCYQILTVVVVAICTLSSISFIYMGSYNPFLYFMF